MTINQLQDAGPLLPGCDPEHCTDRAGGEHAPTCHTEEKMVNPPTVPEGRSNFQDFPDATSPHDVVQAVRTAGIATYQVDESRRGRVRGAAERQGIYRAAVAAGIEVGTHVQTDEWGTFLTVYRKG